MKLRAAEARPRANEKKKASDALDAYTLLDRLDVDGALPSNFYTSSAQPRRDGHTVTTDNGSM